jgi:hypothetical protein
LELPLDQFREVAQQLELSIVETSRPVVDAQGCLRECRLQRGAPAKSGREARRCQWIVGKSIIRRRILHLQHVISGWHGLS